MKKKFDELLDTFQGQWRADKYNGEGELRDSSGAIYTGLWSYGLPTCNPVKLHVSAPEDSWDKCKVQTVQTQSGECFLKLIVSQGEAFTLEAEARTVDDEIVTQSECFSYHHENPLHK